ncbi:MAG: hypothetical protein M3T55_02415 [Pseudomonadota bacterium]|nr:hypothetical protein [Pseudomonadota bacterium]
MPSPAAPLEDPALSAADEAPDLSVLRAERRLRLLQELAEIGMELARALRPRPPEDRAADEAAGGEPAPEKGGGTGRRKGREPADAFGPLSRAIRLTLALEARTDEALRDLKSGAALARQDERAKAAEHAKIAAANDREARQERVRELVMSVAEAESEDAGEYDQLYEALEERLEDDEAYVDCGGRPLRETVERLCGDLALSPDWSRWDCEGWMADDAPARSRFSPFNRPSSRPVLDPGHGPSPAPFPPGRLQPSRDLE